MDLSLTEHQEMLKRSVAAFIEREAPKSVLVAWHEAGESAPGSLFAQIAGLGWLGLTIPAEYGGAGGSLTDAAVVFEEFGKGPVPGPYFTSAVLAAQIVEDAGSEDQKGSLLPAIARGEVVLIPAIADPKTRWGPGAVQTVAERRAGGWTLRGLKPFVHDGAAATHLLCAARTEPGAEGISFFVVDRQAPGVSVRPLRGFLAGVAEVHFDSVEVAADARLGSDGGGWAALDRALLYALPVLCAYQVGSCQRIFEMSVEYSRTRVQFNQPIGRFQRVQDHIIHLINHTDAARWTTYEALWKVDTGRPAEAGVYLAKVVTAEGHYSACNYAHEVHAGIGVSWEYGLNLHTEVSRSLYTFLGDPRYYRRRLGEFVPA